MKTTVTAQDFRDAFRDMDRNYFSCEALNLLFGYFEQFEEDSGEEMELDVISICCDFSEETPEDIAQSYNIKAEDGDLLSLCEQVLGYLEENTILVGETSSGTIVYCSGF